MDYSWLALVCVPITRYVLLQLTVALLTVLVIVVLFLVLLPLLLIKGIGSCSTNQLMYVFCIQTAIKMI